MKEYIERFLERHFQTDWKSCTDEQLYQALLSMTQEKTQRCQNGMKREENCIIFRRSFWWAGCWETICSI